MAVICQTYAETAGAKKWVGNLPVCAITVAVVHTLCMNVVLCMQWKSKPKLVLTNVDTSLTESNASSTLYFQLTEELWNLFCYIDSSGCPCTLCFIILFNWSTVAGAKSGSLERGRIIVHIYQSCQINVYNSGRTLVSRTGERSNLELFWVSHWCENRLKKPLFGGPIVQWTHTVEVTEAYPLICMLLAE